MTDFKKGDIVKNHNLNFANINGVLAVVEDKIGDTFLKVKWITEGADCKEIDGSYFIDRFELLCRFDKDKCKMCYRKLKCITGE